MQKQFLEHCEAFFIPFYHPELRIFKKILKYSITGFNST